MRLVDWLLYHAPGIAIGVVLGLTLRGHWRRTREARSPEIRPSRPEDVK